VKKKYVIPLVLSLGALLSPGRAVAIELPSPSSWFGGGNKSSATITERNKKGPGVMSQMADSTKRVLTYPTSKLAPKKKPVKKTGTTAIIKAKRPEPEKQGFFKSMFAPEPPPPPKTIREWMSLKQIRP
jgi:hypothetical protein